MKVCRLKREEQNRLSAVRLSSTRLLVGLVILGSWAISAAATTLGPEEAKGRVGETATVCGMMACAEYEASERRQPTLLDLGKPHPNAILTAVIYGDHR